MNIKRTKIVKKKNMFAFGDEEDAPVKPKTKMFSNEQPAKANEETVSESQPKLDVESESKKEEANAESQIPKQEPVQEEEKPRKKISMFGPRMFGAPMPTKKKTEEVQEEVKKETQPVEEPAKEPEKKKINLSTPYLLATE